MGGGFKPFYKDPLSAPTRDTERFQVFMGTVMSVDWERGVCTVEDIRSRYTYREVAILPCAHGSFESTSVQMPEVGSTCLCVPLWYVAGHAQVAVLTWTVSNIKTKLDAISRKDFESIPDLNERKRGNYRKAWAGDQGASYSGGYTEKIDSGWDRQSRGLDREDVDAHRRTWSTVTSRHVRYSDAGLGFEGPVVRPDAANITPTVMPDGSREYALYLQPGSQITDRYVGGKQDVLPFAENVSKVQEFALDYPLPPEVLQTALVDFVLGTTQNPWQRTTVSAQGKFQVDSQTYFAAQDFDHPTDLKKPALGPTLNEGATPLRKGFIMERSEGTLVGYSRFDASTYGQVLKPVLSDLTPNTALNGGGRFGADFHSGYNPVVDSTDHIEARLAASCHSVRFPNEYNTTRWDVSKEGMLTFEVGSTMPKEKIQFQPANAYEHPHGAGRSVEGHLVGSLKLVVGKNRDEEDSIDLQAIGQTVLRLGCDDATLPDSGRKVETQIRGSADAVQQRTLQYWAQPKYGAGDAVTLENKKGMESVSLRMATDGAIVARVGARKDKVPVLRKHIINGYSDGPGRQQDPSAKNSHSPGRPIYGAGDSVYAFTHGTGSTQYTGLSQAGSPRADDGALQRLAEDPRAGGHGRLRAVRGLPRRPGRPSPHRQEPVLGSVAPARPRRRNRRGGRQGPPGALPHRGARRRGRADDRAEQRQEGAAPGDKRRRGHDGLRQHAPARHRHLHPGVRRVPADNQDRPCGDSAADRRIGPFAPHHGSRGHRPQRGQLRFIGGRHRLRGLGDDNGGI